MNESVQHDIAQAGLERCADVSAVIAALRTAGAHQFDPIRLHYMQALAERASLRKDNVKRILEDKLTLALAAFRERFAQAQRDARESIDQVAPQHPQAAQELQQLFTAGDFQSVKRCIATLRAGPQRTPLGDLVRNMEQNGAQPVDGAWEGNTGSRVELKTVRDFRNTWSKLSVDKQVAQALDQAPKNAGPINSHMLVLRSLALMRDISPDYLNRFMSYADTLLCLDQYDQAKQAISKKAVAGETGKKMNPRNGRNR